MSEIVAGFRLDDFLISGVMMFSRSSFHISVKLKSTDSVGAACVCGFCIIGEMSHMLNYFAQKIFQKCVLD